MILITGGSWQGKLDYARERFALRDDEIQLCDERTEALDASRRCVAYLERYALNRVRAGEDPLPAAEALARAPGERILIATDISCGVVPADPLLRAWREASGRMSAMLAARADEVWRLFCGLPQRLK